MERAASVALCKVADRSVRQVALAVLGAGYLAEYTLATTPALALLTLGTQGRVSEKSWQLVERDGAAAAHAPAALGEPGAGRAHGELAAGDVARATPELRE